MPCESEKKTYTPFAPRVHDPIAQHKSTGTTDEIATAEFLYDVGVWVSAVGADEPDCEIRPEGGLLRLLELLCKRKWLRVRHVRWKLGERADEGQSESPT